MLTCVDHCADILRQKLMCDADTGIITYNWVKHHRLPHANFNVEHKCRNFEDVLSWVYAHRAPAPLGGEVPKKEGYVEFSDVPHDPHAHF